MIMVTNRQDVLDPTLHQLGHMDGKIEIPLPNEQTRMDVSEIHVVGIAKHGNKDYELLVKLVEVFLYSFCSFFVQIYFAEVSLCYKLSYIDNIFLTWTWLQWSRPSKCLHISWHVSHPSRA